MWFIRWLLFIAGCSLIVWEMSNGNWIISCIMLGSYFIVATIIEIIREPKETITKVLSAMIGFAIIFGILAVASQEDPAVIEEQTEYIQNNQ